MPVAQLCPHHSAPPLPTRAGFPLEEEQFPDPRGLQGGGRLCQGCKYNVPGGAGRGGNCAGRKRPVPARDTPRDGGRGGGTPRVRAACTPRSQPGYGGGEGGSAQRCGAAWGERAPPDWGGGAPHAPSSARLSRGRSLRMGELGLTAPPADSRSRGSPEPTPPSPLTYISILTAGLREH